MAKKDDQTIRTSLNFVGPRGYLLIEDKFAGKADRYTVYEIAVVGDRKARIIGRELDAEAARALIIERNAPTVPDSKHRTPRTKRAPKAVKRSMRARA